MSYKTAWLLKHKLLQTMLLREAPCRAAWKGAWGSMMRTWAVSAQVRIHGGRGPASKSAFVAAVQTSEYGKPRFMRLTPIGAFASQALKDWVASHLMPTAYVVYDSLQCFKPVSSLAATHQRYVTGGGRQLKHLSCAGLTRCRAASRPLGWHVSLV